MSRAAIFNALTTDVTLNSLGITGDSVFPNYSLDERPVNSGPFLILRWGEGDNIFWDNVNGPRRLDVWAHYPVEVTEDHHDVDLLLKAVDSVMLSMVQVDGGDGRTITCIRSIGRSSDMKDEGFQTISRYTSYEVLSREN